MVTVKHPPQTLPLNTEKEAAEKLNVSVHKLRRDRWAGGGIPFVKIGDGAGGAVRYRPEDIAAYIESRMRRSTSNRG